MYGIEGYNNGLNLGGWLSQYQRFETAHFQSFITESDVERIASWGFDHLRLPVDYPVLEEDSMPFQYKEEGFGYIDRCLAWSKKYGIKLILDLHKAPGFDFSHCEEQKLFTEAALQERYLGLWRAFTERYLNEGDNLVFELLNEVVLEDSQPWNVLAERTVEMIRAIDPNRWIIIGGNHYNSVFTLKDLNVLDDSRMIYTFHFYEPLLFTHQKAPWIEILVDMDQELHYPGEFVGLAEYLQSYAGGKKAPTNMMNIERYTSERLDKELLRKDLQPAIDFIKKHNKPLYCGEFGVIDYAPMQSRANWQKDLTDLMEELGIGRAYWSYKAMDFGLVDQDGRIIDENLVIALGGKP